MYVFNSSMRLALSKINSFTKKISSELSNIAMQGFLKRDTRFFLLALEAYSSSVSDKNFEDDIAFECFVNSLHVDDYESEDFLEAAVLFVAECFKSWRAFTLDNNLIAIVSADDVGVAVKFHVERDGKVWAGGDIEDFEDSILIVSSNSKKFRFLLEEGIGGRPRLL